MNKLNQEAADEASHLLARVCMLIRNNNVEEVINGKSNNQIYDNQ
jgi:hypothetical protein